MKEDLLRFKTKQKYVFFDFETCNLNLGSLDNKPWQLGLIIINDGKAVEKHNFWLHWDDLKMSATAAKMTGWTEKEYKKLAVDPMEPLNILEGYLYDEDYINVGHNTLGFDVYIHGTYRRCLGMSPNYSYIDRSIDTVCLAKAIKNDIKFKQDEDFFSWQYKLNNMMDRKSKKKLIDLCNHYEVGIDEDRLHDALYDIEQNYEVFKKMIWEVEV